MVKKEIDELHQKGMLINLNSDAIEWLSSGLSSSLNKI